MTDLSFDIKEQKRIARNEYMRAYYHKNPDHAKLTRERAAKFYKNNMEYSKNRQRTYRLSKPKKHLFYAARKRAREKSIEFTITEDDFNIVHICPVLGIPIIYGLKAQLDNSPTLDRVDNAKGYIAGNVRVVSWRANNLKSFGSAEEHQAIADYINRHSTDGAWK